MLGSCGINNIPIFEEAVNDAWVDVQAHYRKRADLVMQLLDVVEPLKASEADVFDQINAAETKVFEMHMAPDMLEDKQAFTDFQDSQNELSEALEKMLDTVQTYPDVADTDAFVDIAASLGENKKLIDVARRSYWESVERFNSELVAAPGRWWQAFVYPKTRKKENFPEPTEERTGDN